MSICVSRVGGPWPLDAACKNKIIFCVFPKAGGQKFPFKTKAPPRLLGKKKKNFFIFFPQ